MQSEDPGTSTREEAFLLHVRELVTPQQFETWFRSVSVEEMDDAGIRLLVPNQFACDWLMQYYASTLAQAVRRAFGADRRITIAVDPHAPPPPDIERAPSPAVRGGEAVEPLRTVQPARALLESSSDTILHDEYTFANFVVGASNRFAHAAATAVAEAPGRSYNPFFLHGSVGLGKTHLLQAICHHVLTANPHARILYLSCESFINQFIDALENNALSTFRQKYRNVDVLLVDDIHLLANKERTQEEFFHTFNTLYNLGKQIALSSDAPPRDIPTLQERLVSRFKMGMVVEIAPPDFETRVNILKRKARLRQVELPEDAAHYLAEHVSTNIRELEGAVVRLLGYAKLTDRPLSVELAREAITSAGDSRASAVTIQDIVTAVTKYFNVKLSDLQSKRRTQSITLPRQVCMSLARKLTNLSLEEIGGYFGGRDHTTVLYAIDKIEGLVAEDPKMAELLRRLERDIRS